MNMLNMKTMNNPPTTGHQLSNWAVGQKSKALKTTCFCSLCNGFFEVLFFDPRPLYRSWRYIAAGTPSASVGVLNPIDSSHHFDGCTPLDRSFHTKKKHQARHLACPRHLVLWRHCCRHVSRSMTWFQWQKPTMLWFYLQAIQCKKYYKLLSAHAEEWFLSIIIITFKITSQSKLYALNGSLLPQAKMPQAKGQQSGGSQLQCHAKRSGKRPMRPVSPASPGHLRWFEVRALQTRPYFHVVFVLGWDRHLKYSQIITGDLSLMTLHASRNLESYNCIHFAWHAQHRS